MEPRSGGMSPTRLFNEPKPLGQTLMNFIDWWVRVLQNRWVSGAVMLTVLTTTIALGVSGAFAINEYCDDKFHPSANLQSYTAYQLFESDFPQFMNDVETLYIRNKRFNRTVIDGPEASFIVQNFSRGLLLRWPTLFTDENYWNVPELLKPNYLSPDSNTMLALYHISSQGSAQMEIVRAAAVSAAQLDAQWTDQFEVKFTGALANAADNHAQPVAGASDADYDHKYIRSLAAIPIILIFWLVVGSLRLLLIPICTMAASLISSWGIGAQIAQHHLQVPTYEPSIIFFLSSALSVNYNIFMLTRWQKERAKPGTEPSAAVAWMLSHDGATVALSGFILTVVWLALCFFPVSGVDALGLCSALTVAMCVLYNLLLTPALLLCWLQFFSRASLSWKDSVLKLRQVLEKASPNQEHPEDPEDRTKPEGEPSSSPYAALESPCSAQEEELEPDQVTQSCYYRISAKLTSGPLMRWSVPVLVVLAMLGGCVPLLHIKPALTSDVHYEDNSVGRAYHDALEVASGVVQQRFGVLVKYASAQETTNITSGYFAEPLCTIAQKLRTDQGVMPDSVQSIATLRGSEVCQKSALQDCMGPHRVYNHSSYAKTCHEVRWLVNRYGNFETLSSLVVFSSNFNPYSHESRELTHRVLDMLKGIQDTNFEMHLYGPGVGEADAEAFTMQRFPWVLIPSVVLIFTVVSVRFQAALVPLKLVFTMAVPILFVYGMATGVFQYGWLQPLHLYLFNNNGVSWLTLLSTVFLLIGLALDYDLFLFSRVHELRKQQVLQTREAVNQAMGFTGPVISGAGVCMASVLCSMVDSESILLNQMVFILFVGVLVDVYVVRVVLVPCVLSTCGWLNWWPTRMPIDFDSKSASTPRSAHRLRPGSHR